MTLSEPYLTAKELADRLGIEIGKIRELRQEGMPSVQYGKTLRFLFSQVEQWMKTHQEQDQS